MAIAPRGSQLRIAYDPSFTPQANVDTANNVSTLTAVLQVTARNHVDSAETVDEVFDCSGQFKIEENILTRIGRLTVEFDASPTLILGFLGACMGNSSGNNLVMLDEASFQPPYLTLAVGFVGAIADPGVLFKSVVVNSFKITSASRERVKCSMELVGSGDLGAASITWPDCTETLPVYGFDGALTINSADRMVKNGAIGTNTTSIELDYSNNLLSNTDPFQLADDDITRLERADRRTHMLNWKVEGYVGDATYTAAKTNPRTKWPVIWRIGPLNNCVTLTATSAILTAEQKAQTFEGEANRATLNLKLEPTLDGSTLPLSGVADLS